MKRSFGKVLVLLSLVVLPVQIHASTQTLPGGVWNFSAGQETYGLSKVGGETYAMGATGAEGNGDWKHVELEDFTGKYIPGLFELKALLTSQGAGAMLDLDKKLADSYTYNKSTLGIAYGLTKMIGANPC